MLFVYLRIISDNDECPYSEDYMGRNSEQSLSSYIIDSGIINRCIKNAQNKLSFGLIGQNVLIETVLSP